jgi:hypothetical protein
MRLVVYGNQRAIANCAWRNANSRTVHGAASFVGLIADEQCANE